VIRRSKGLSVVKCHPTGNVAECAFGLLVLGSMLRHALRTRCPTEAARLSGVAERHSCGPEL